MHTLIVCVCSCCIWIAEQWLKPLKALCCTMLYSVCYALMAFAFAFASELHFLLLEQWKNPNVLSTIKSSRIESINRHTLIQCQTAFSAIPNNLWAAFRMRESAATLMFNKYCNCITRFFHLSSALYILICRFSGVYVIWSVGSVGRTTFKFKQIEHTRWALLFYSKMFGKHFQIAWNDVSISKTVQIKRFKDWSPPLNLLFMEFKYLRNIRRNPVCTRQCWDQCVWWKINSTKWKAFDKMLEIGKFIWYSV